MRINSAIEAIGNAMDSTTVMMEAMSWVAVSAP